MIELDIFGRIMLNIGEDLIIEWIENEEEDDGG